MVTPNDDELQATLRAGVEGLAVALLGEPTKRLTDRRSMKWGAKGSLTLSLQGPKRGSWFNHEAGYGGGPLQLIVHARFCSYHDAEEWAREWLSLPREKRGAYTGIHPAAALLAGLADATGPDADDAKRIATAQRLWKASAPVAGTLGDHYLTAHRGIPCPSHGWPEAVRFHPDSRALIVAATLPDGTVQAVQRVRLTAGGAKISCEDAEKLSPPTSKVTNGVQVGAVIRLPARSLDAPLLLAEGPETGLSVWAATGAETWVALGSMSRLELPAGRRMAACRDDDQRYSPADLSITRALSSTFRNSGCETESLQESI
jgi:putative DNA primase/helicase